MSLPSHTARLLWKILLLIEAWNILGHDAHSLCLNLTVKSQARPGQPWCEVQGSVDRKPFLQYDSDNNTFRPVGLLGEKVNATNAWTDLTQTLGEVGQELRMVLPVIRLEKNRTRGKYGKGEGRWGQSAGEEGAEHTQGRGWANRAEQGSSLRDECRWGWGGGWSAGLPTLQVKLCCQREAGRYTGASWQFSFNGQTAVFDTMSMNWTVIGPGVRGIQEEWENSQDLAEHFRKLSAGDCSHWLREFLEHWEKVLEPTVQSVKFSDNCQASSIQLITWIIPSIFICSVLIGIIITKHRRRSGTRKVRSRLASGSRGGHSLMRTWER
ncbi:retinoic acid early transcript 1E [Equus caballus]|uniref:retinoic acid early transcript 1E n=1 Tax=Equus caballus TaxID=9796 RepID=UPI0038B3E409